MTHVINILRQKATPVIRSVDEDSVVIPDHELLLVLARLLSPQRHHPLLVADEHDPGLGELLQAALPAVPDRLADLVDVLFAVTSGVATLTR